MKFFFLSKRKQVVVSNNSPSCRVSSTTIIKETYEK